MRRSLATFGCVVFFALPAFALAADCSTNTGTTDFVPLACYNGSALQDLYSTSGENALASFFNKLFAFSLSIGAIIAVVMIVWGGYLYMFKDSFASKLNAKEKITNAVIGLLLLLGIYLILYQINPDILSLRITFPQSSGGSAAPAASPEGPFQQQTQPRPDLPTDYIQNPDGTCLYRNPYDPSGTVSEQPCPLNPPT